MITKNLPVGEAIWKIPFRLGLNKIFAFKALFKGHGEIFIPVFKAHFHYLEWLFFKKKMKTGSKRSSKLNGVYKGLVIWQYFVNKKKTFSEIVITKDNI